MKTVFTTLLVLLSTSVFAATTDKAPAPDAKTMEMMKAFEKFAKPGKEHQLLADMAGEWNYTSKMWMDANGAAEESAGSSSMKMILGGRWLQHEVKGMAMGKPFEGLGLTGFDNVKGKYETVWLDTMSTGLTSGSGDYNSKTKTLVDKGSYSCPLSSDKRNEYRGEWKIVSKNKMIYSMYGTPPNETKEFKQMEMTFTRK